MLRSAALLLLLLADEPAPDRWFSLPDAVKGRVKDHRLELRRGNETASLPLPEDVDGIDGVAKGKTTKLSLDRFCPPPRTLSLTKGDIDARFLFDKANALWKRGSKAEAVEALKAAAVAAPAQTDVRFALAARQFEIGNEAAAVDALRDAATGVTAQTYWGVLEDKRVVALLPKLGLPQREVGLGSEPAAPLRLFVSRGRRWFAWVTDEVEIRAFDGTPVFTGGITRRNDLDEDEKVRPDSAAGVLRRWRDADKLLGAFGFEPIASLVEADSTELSDDTSLSWVRWKALGVVASSGNNIIRVRQAGKVIFERKIEVGAAIKVDWGQYVPEGSYLFVGWDRVAGPDECAVRGGMEIVQLPPAPATPSKRP